MSYTSSFERKKVLIIGARGGIGSEIVKSFMQYNCDLFLTGSTLEGIQSFCKSLDTSGFQGKVYSSGLDLSKKDEVSDIVNKAINDLGEIDILICNAGTNEDRLAIRMSDDDWEKVVNINLNATFCINRDALKNMFKRKFGKIVNVSSVVASIGNFGQANYCASKAGIEAMSRVLAAEYAGRNINVNCIAPGFIDTNMTQKMPEQAKERMLQMIPAKRYGNPSEIAKVILFLASEEASYINGQVIHVNGGLLMK